MQEQRFFLERRQDRGNMPLVDDAPLSASRLLGLLVGIIVIALVYALPQTWVTNSTPVAMTYVIQFISSVLPLLLFVALFRYGAKESMTKLYKRLKWRDLGFGLVMTILSLIYSTVMGLLLKGQTAPNGAVVAMKGVGESRIVSYFITNEIISILNLMIEELLAVSFFLVLSALVMQHMHVSRNAGIWWGLIGSMIFFGMIHFVAYDWHILQMLLVIGVGRIFDTGMYIRTKNIWISYIFHFLWDSILFFTSVF
ncbi:CPBP family glutamic-type intramembrane protease [Lacticaseibacillus saniviri]